MSSAVEKVQAVLDRIKEKDGKVNSIIAINPNAIRDAEVLDNEVEEVGQLHGEPVLIKDNIDVADMATTAGSLALKDNIAKVDAPIVASLKKAGAIIVAKTNLSEWANFRDGKSTSGWSAIGGLTRNPVADDDDGEPLTALGSSSGSGAAVALGLADAAIGTETDGSIICPAAICGIVGLKPTTGVLSSNGIVPISHSQDTAGPMAKDVRTATIMMSSLASNLKIDVTDTLKVDSIKGKKLGVMRYMCTQFDEEVMSMFESCLDKLRKAGAVTVDIPEESAPQLKDIDDLEFEKVLLPEFKDDMNNFLKGTDPEAVKCRTLADLIQFNKDNAEKELPHFGQEFFELAEATKGRKEPDYAECAAKIKRLAGPDGIDKLLKDFDCSVLVSPSCSPAFKVCLDGGDSVHGSGWDHRRSPMLPAVSGYPHLTVPMGRTKSNRPLGMSFIGTARSEALLLSVGYAFEQINMPV